MNNTDYDLACELLEQDGEPLNDENIEKKLEEITATKEHEYLTTRDMVQI